MLKMQIFSFVSHFKYTNISQGTSDVENADFPICFNYTYSNAHPRQCGCVSLVFVHQI